MALPLGLVAARQSEARTLQDFRAILNEEGIEGLIQKRGVHALTLYENLVQKEGNSEFEPQLGESAVQNLANTRITAMQERVKEGQPPFKPTLQIWTWDKATKHFIGHGIAEGTLWQPDYLIFNPYEGALPRISRR